MTRSGRVRSLRVAPRLRKRGDLTRTSQSRFHRRAMVGQPGRLIVNACGSRRRQIVLGDVRNPKANNYRSSQTSVFLRGPTQEYDRLSGLGASAFFWFAGVHGGTTVALSAWLKQRGCFDFFPRPRRRQRILDSCVLQNMALALGAVFSQRS
jgi:hypothetical protein